MCAWLSERGRQAGKEKETSIILSTPPRYVSGLPYETTAVILSPSSAPAASSYVAQSVLLSSKKGDVKSLSVVAAAQPPPAHSFVGRSLNPLLYQ
jgi:hypothetical protein